MEAQQPRPFYTRFPLLGEAISHRIGTERSWDDMVQETAAADDDDGGGGGLPDLGLEDVQRLPPCVLMSSCSDVTVPW